MSPDTTKVASTAGRGAHSSPTAAAEISFAGPYTVRRSVLVTVRFQRLPQNSWREPERYGSSEGGSSSSPTKPRTTKLDAATRISIMRKTSPQYATITSFGWTESLYRRIICNNTAKPKVSVAKFKGNFLVLRWELLCRCFTLMGREAMTANRKRDLVGPMWDESGPRSKAKRKSLKLESQVKKKETMAERTAEERKRGRMVKRIFADRLRTGKYTVGRRILGTIRFHRRPQKSWSEVANHTIKGSRTAFTANKNDDGFLGSEEETLTCEGLMGRREIATKWRRGSGG
nr:hypothetical protein PanWU01x14_051620 [Ipomoea batatas]